MMYPPDTLFMPCIGDANSHSDYLPPWQRWSGGGGMSFTRRSLEAGDHLILADNLDLLRFLPDRCVDLIYIDPPFSTGKRRESPLGDEGPVGYDDIWNDPESFVEWLAPRLRELWRILDENGNFVIHLDTRAIHHVRIYCDREFGSEHWENEIIWHYTGGGRSKNRFSRKHDVLLWYSKGSGRIFNIDAIREPYEPTSGYAKGGIVSKKGKKYMPHPEGKPVDDVWEIPIVNPMSRERTAYPTQKPVRLMERIVSALSDKNSVVCDVFAGSGTTAVVCRELNRRFICADNNPDAIGVALDRLQGADLPAVLSYGFYRLAWADEKYARSIAERLVREGLGDTESEFEVIASSRLNACVVKLKSPPGNPGKTADSNYSTRHGKIALITGPDENCTGTYIFNSR